MRLTKLRLLTIILTFAGLLDAIYLIWLKIADNPALCIRGLGDCWTVNTSRYSEIFGIPVAVFGAGAYLVIAVLLIFGNRSGFIQDNSNIIFFGITLVGFVFSGYLTYLEFFVINAVCPFCILSALIMTALFIISIYRLVKSQAIPNSIEEED